MARGSAAVSAQSPNTASIVVLVADQTGGVVKDAKVTVTNTATGAVREAMSNAEGSATMPTLSLTGTYKIDVTKEGFHRGKRARAHAARRRNGDGEGEARRRAAARATSRSTARPRACAPTRRSASASTRATIDETPILGRKLTTLPLFSSAFRQGKGTGDLFVNATYFVTGAGSRRTVTYMLDGANNDEGWGRQTMLANVPVGAVQEVTVLSNAFSAEYGFTAGPALNIVTKSGTNQLHGEGLFMDRPGGWQAKSFSTDGLLPAVSLHLHGAGDAHRDLAGRHPGQAESVLGLGRRRDQVKDKTFFFAAADYTRQDRTVALSSTLPAFVLRQRQPHLRRSVSIRAGSTRASITSSAAARR